MGECLNFVAGVVLGTLAYTLVMMVMILGSDRVEWWYRRRRAARRLPRARR